MKQFQANCPTTAKTVASRADKVVYTPIILLENKRKKMCIIREDAV